MTLNLNNYELEWWTNGIVWILDNIINTYKGTNSKEQNLLFWRHIFKYYYGGGSGVNPSIDGWIVNFFPYINDRPSQMAIRNFETCIQQCAKGDQNEDDDDEEWYLNADDEQPGLDIDDLKKSSSGINITPFQLQNSEG